MCTLPPMVHVTPRDQKKKYAHDTAIAMPTPSAPGPLAPTPTPPASVPSTLLLHETQDFDHEFLRAVRRNPEGRPWYPDRFALGREPDISSPSRWVAGRK